MLQGRNGADEAEEQGGQRDGGEALASPAAAYPRQPVLGEGGAQKEFENAGRHEVERRRRRHALQRESESEGDREGRHPRAGAAASRQRMQRQGEQRRHHVELFLDAETPGVEQRLRRGIGVEIADLRQEEEVRHTREHGEQAARQSLEIDRQQHDDRGDGTEQGGDVERRQRSAQAATVEGKDREPPRRKPSDEIAMDEVPRDDEKDIDSEEAAGEAGRLDVAQDHGDDGQGSQPVDVGAVARHSWAAPLHRRR